MLYGFLLAFAAISVAAVYDHFLAWQAPYPTLPYGKFVHAVCRFAALLRSAAESRRERS